jgi:tetratricopeptide (TPR) repeat protein
MSNKQRETFDSVLALIKAGDPLAAMGAAEKGLLAYPDDGNLMCLAARAAIALQQLDAARRYAEAATGRYPDFAAAHDVLGDLLLVEGRANAALEAYEKALRLEPERPSVKEKMARARKLRDATPSAVLGGRLQRQQGAFASQLVEAEAHEKAGERDKAETIYRDILKQDPEHVEASRLLAGIAAEYEQYREAIVFLRRAIELAPDYSRAWVDLANVQRKMEEYDDAIATAEKVIELGPDKPEAHLLLASVLGFADRHNEAIAAYEKVLQLAPGKTGALCSMAHHLKTIGKRDDAIARYRECIATRNGHAEAYWSLANLKTFRFEDSEVQAMHAQLASDDLDSLSRAQVHNALGLEYEGRKDYDKAFENFEKCNLLQRQAESYDPVETEATTDRIIALFDAAFLGRGSETDVDPSPIFVVGLPRSGSTLIEQILASHSSVEGTHELNDLSRVVRAMGRGAGRQLRFPDTVKGLKPSGWARMGRKYIESTDKHRSGGPYFIDKNPNNFVFAGLIRMAMPNAKIINARRHPLDSCFGSYKQLFASGQPFTYDLTELGEYYLQYQRIMDHWHTVMPGFVLDVHYEQVVGDLEGEVRRILDFCGLPFEESCLRFHETERAVKTASSEQVRQPIYSTSVNLWRNYEDHLDTLVQILRPLLHELPDVQQPPN